MATITTDTFLDGGVARTAGEAWTMNGGVLTIRTDTRWHANAPASMLGSIGSTTTSATLGGGVLLDGRNVRQLAYDTGSGTVPAIGTLVTQGGVTGYLLAVYANMTSAPTAVGAAMPATGFLKFREVTGGAFAAGALTGISASATGADVVGWIEVVQDQAVANTVPRLGFFRTRGDWFELGVTSGAAAQTFQVPTNGGGAGTHVPAVWIETGVGTNVYESYPALLAAAMIPANLGTDARSKFVESVGGGVVRIGNNGTTNVGFVPPAGCRVRIPNVLGRQTSATNRALNLVPNATLATRPDFTTTSAGDIDFEFFMNDWYHLFASPFKVRMVNVATFDIHSTSNEAAPTELNNYCVGAYLGTSITLTLTSNPLGGTIIDSKFFRVGAATNGHGASLTTSSNYVFTNCHFGIITFARSTGYAFVANQCREIVMNNHYQYNGDSRFSTCANITINDIGHCDRFVGNTNATSPLYVVVANTSSDNIKVDGITFGLLGTIANTNPYAGVVFAQNSSNLIFRNAGTRTTPLAVTSGNAPAYIFQDGGVNDGVLVQRMYMVTRTSAYLTINTTKNLTMESVHGTVGSLQTLSLNTLVKGVRAASNSVTGGASVYGTHVFDMFTGDTTGVLWFAMNEPTTFSASDVVLTLAGATGGFTSGGQVSMPTIGDQLIITMPYFAIGITALANAVPTLTGTLTGNFTYEYAIDTGSGFGVYQTLNGANLSAETINPTIGFRLRLRITTATANTTNALTYVRINTVSTLAAQIANLYPLNTVASSFSLTGLAVGTEVVLFNSANVEIDRQVLAGTTYTYNYTWVEEDGDSVNNYVLIWKDDKTPLKLTSITLGENAQSIPIVQTDDLVYGVIASPKTTFNTTSFLQIADTGVIQLSIQELYSEWKDWILLTNNAQYTFMYVALGGNPISGAISLPFYIFMDNSWRIRPQEADHTLNIVEGIVVATGDPFVDTVGAFTVRINYQQPVQALTVSTGGGGGATPADIWSFSTRTLSSGGVSAIQSGLATEANATANKNEVQVDLNIINENIQKASLLIPATQDL